MGTTTSYSSINKCNSYIKTNSRRANKISITIGGMSSRVGKSNKCARFITIARRDWEPRVRCGDGHYDMMIGGG